MSYMSTENAGREWACFRKKAYPNEKLAKSVARKINADGADVVVYACAHCGQFHVGRRLAVA